MARRLALQYSAKIFGKRYADTVVSSEEQRTLIYVTSDK